MILLAAALRMFFAAAIVITPAAFGEGQATRGQ